MRWCTIILTLLVTSAPSPAVTRLYESQFEKGPPGPEWSQRDVKRTPAGGRSMLGEYVTEPVTLSLDDLPKSHRYLRLSFDLFILMSWDGSGSETSPGETVGPDFMRVRLQGGPVLLYHTFSNIPDDDRFPDDMKIQTYPSPVPGQQCRARQGAAAEDSLGYFMRIRTRGRGIPMDTTYRFSYLFPHTADSANIEFRAIGLQYAARAKVDESWGIDRVVVEALDESEVTPPTETEAADLLKTASAADSDPDAADNAYRHLLQGGPAVRALMLKALRDDAFERAAIDTLKQDIGSPDPATRDRAKSQLARFPGLRELILRELELDGESPEVRESATSQLKTLKPLTDPKDRRAAVAARVLQVIGFDR